MPNPVWETNVAESAYSSWKLNLKRFLVQHMYHQLILNAIRSFGNARLLLKTDLWVECVGMNQLEGIDDRLEVCGLDISASICEAAKPVMLGKHITNASITELPFKSDAFDVLIDISTTDHVSHHDAARVISEYARVLRPKGILVMCLDSKLSLLWEMYRKFLLRYPAYSWMPHHVRAMIAANDFKILKGFFGNSFLDSLIPQIEQIHGPVYNAIFSTISQYYIVIARKSDHSKPQ